MGWYDRLIGLVADAMADGVGRLEWKGPDHRSNVRLVAEHNAAIVYAGLDTKTFRPGEAAAACSYFAAMVEGGS